MHSPPTAPLAALLPSRRLTNAFAALCALTLASLALFWGALLPLAAPWEYAEGDCATWIWMLRHGESLYGAATGLAMRKSNYPPVYLQSVAWLAPADGAILWTGRLVSLAGFALAAAAVTACVRRATGSWGRAACAVALLAGSAWFGEWAAVCRPDALAVGLGSLGVACVALRPRGWPLLAAVLFAASLLTKHSLIVFPAGAIVWALLRDPPRGVLLGGATAALIVGALTLGHLFQPLVQDSIAGWELHRFLKNAFRYAVPLLPGIALALGTLRLWPALTAESRAVAGPWLCVLLVGVPWMASLGRIGSSYNYAFELVAALSVLAVLAPATGLRAALLLGHAALGLGFTAKSVAEELIVTRPRAAVEMRAAREALASVRGEVLSEQSAHALSAGHPGLVVPFLAAQLAAAGRWDAGPLVRALERGEVERVLLEFPADDARAADELEHRERFPAGVLPAVRARYRLERRAGDLHVYRPR